MLPVLKRTWPAVLQAPAMNRKSILAEVAGLLTIIVLSTLVDIVLHATGVYPPWNVPIDDRLSALATSYRVVISIGGAWLTARLAPEKPMKHALILGAIGTVLGFIGVAASWNKGLGPMWYPIALAVLAVPQCWVGGWLREKQLGLR